MTPAETDTSAIIRIPAAGQIVAVRNRRWVVDAVDARHPDDELALVRLSCLDDDAQGDELTVLWTREYDARILGEDAWKRIGEKGFDDAHIFGAFLHTLRWNCVTATDPKLFQSPFRAGIRLDAYQLEPLAKALQMPRVNLFIADDVGLGKTIEAGLITSELLLRRRLREVVVAAPPSMLQQWKEELDSRFGLTFEILDRDYVERVRGTRGFGVNPWTTFPRFLVSHRLLTDETYLGPLRDWLGAFRPSTMFILDEAHHAAPASGSRYAIDSHITRGVRDLAGRFEHRLFLSATPHNGHPHSFSALLEILDPNRFTRGVKVNATHVREVMVRRLKDDIREVSGGFPVRSVQQIDLDCSESQAPELRLATLLNEYWDARESSMQEATRREQTAMGLLLSGLQQRLFSSVEAFSRTLSRHRATMERLWGGEKITTGKGRIDRDALRGIFDADDERSLESDEARAEEEDAAIDTATAASYQPHAHQREKDLLDQMEILSRKARLEPDQRVRWLVDWIRANMCLGATLPGDTPAGKSTAWTDLRLIVFTEYEDTRRWLVDWLRRALEGTDRADERIAVYHGATPFDRREEIKRAFNAPPAQHPVRILVCTDAAREGLNLQAHCWNLVHFDVPWNPARMEQRNGRIDRKLQPAPQVTCRYFVYTNRPEDRILETLVKKTDTIRKDLGSIAKVLEARLATTLDKGIRRKEIIILSQRMQDEERALRERKEAEEELETQRLRADALRKSINGLEQRLESAKSWIGLDHRHLKDCLDASLELQGVEPLAETQLAGRRAFVFPDLDRRHGADPSWASTLSLLRRPALDGTQDSGIRPVVFDPPETVDDETVQLHLEHRVVKRLLSRFLSQGFLHHDLSRACLTQSRDGIPRVVLLARLTVHGHAAARLHEEIIPIAARWIAPERREGGLKPFAREAEAKTLAQIEEALLPENRGAPLPRDVQERLLTACPRDIEELLAHLEPRAQEILTLVKADLRERAEQEKKSLTDVLEDQRKRVQRELAQEADLMQISLGIQDPEERRTLESNVRYWKQWLSRVEETLAREPARIEAFYEPKSTRIEPVGIAYLWPAEGVTHG